jgi:hypothetical protein
MSGRLKPSTLLSFLLILVVVLAWALFLHTQFEAVRSVQWQIDLATLISASVCGAVYFLGLALVWGILVQEMSANRQHVSRSWVLAAARVWLLSMVTRYLPGNIWHILSRVALAGQLGASRSQVLASATIEQGLTLIGAFSLFGLSLPFWRGEEPRYSWFLLVIPCGLFALHPHCLGRMLAWLAQRTQRPELVWNYRYCTMLGLVALYALANLWAGLGLVILLTALHPAAVSHGVFIVGSAALAWAIGYLSIVTPSGLGVREGVLTLLLSQIAPLSVVVVVVIWYRLALSLGELLITAMAWVYGFWCGLERPANHVS